MGPMLRYFKNQPFGLPTHRDRGDKEDIVTTISQDENAFIAFRNACSTESRETSPQKDTDQTDKGAKNSPKQGSKLWRPNMASSNSYRRFLQTFLPHTSSINSACSLSLVMATLH